MRDVGLLPPGLRLASRGTGVEVYEYTDSSDGSFFSLAIDNSATLSVWDQSGQPEIPVRVMRWLCDRADYLAGDPPAEVGFRGPAYDEPI